MYAVIGALVFVMLVFLMMGVRVVRQGYVYTIERLGKFTLSAEPGLHLIVPFVDRVGQKVNMPSAISCCSAGRNDEAAASCSWLGPGIAAIAGGATGRFEVAASIRLATSIELIWPTCSMVRRRSDSHGAPENSRRDRRHTQDHCLSGEYDRTETHQRGFDHGIPTGASRILLDFDLVNKNDRVSDDHDRDGSS